MWTSIYDSFHFYTFSTTDTGYYSFSGPTYASP